MLKMSKSDLNLIADPDMFIFFEEGMTGGVFCISNRCSQANNKYLKSYHTKQVLKHTIYLEANDLFSYTMSKFLQIIGFK